MKNRICGYLQGNRCVCKWCKAERYHKRIRRAVKALEAATSSMVSCEPPCIEEIARGKRTIKVGVSIKPLTATRKVRKTAGLHEAALAVLREVAVGINEAIESLEGGAVA